MYCGLSAEVRDILIGAMLRIRKDERAASGPGCGPPGRQLGAAAGRGRQFLANFRSLSAASAPIFASKYAFLSIFQNLPDYLGEFFEK